MPDDPLAYRAHADAIVQRAADQLRELLKTVAARIDPFPPFPGSMFSYGIEVDGVQTDSDLGCVVLAEDGGLYELRLGMDMDALAAGASEPTATRSEERIPLTDLPPADYVAYAYRAVEAALEHLERQG